MTITADIFEAFLNCPTKCYLRSLGEVGTGNAYADWLCIQNESWRRERVKCLTAGTAPGEYVGSPSATTSLKLAKWQFATEYVVRSENLESRLHAVERIPAGGRSETVQFIPIRFIPTNKISRNDKLLLAFDALVLSELLGHEVGKEACKKLTQEKASIYVASSDFDQYVIKCPICGSDTVASGQSEFDTAYAANDENLDRPIPVLTFHPDEMHCEDCGLEIDDSRDFPLAGLADNYDRSDDLDKWAAQQGYSYGDDE